MHKKTALTTVLFSVLLLLPALTLLPAVTADVYVPPGPPRDMSEWIFQGLHVYDLQNMMPIGWKYTDGPHYDPRTQEEYDKVHYELEGPTVIPFSTWVLVFGYIPGVVVSPDQTPPPIVLVITWNGVPYAVTLEAPGPVGFEYPPVKYGDPVPHVPEPIRDLLPCVETVYPWVYPTDGGPDGEWKKAYYNVWFGDFDCDLGGGFGLYFWYIFHPNVGDWIAFNCEGTTKHPPTYDITALFEYSTSQIWLNHKCFDVRLLEVHKEIEPDRIRGLWEERDIILEPIEDSTVWSVDPDGNYGGDLYLHARSDRDATARSYLKFDLSGINPICEILSAELRMYCIADGNPTYPLLDVDAYVTTDDWGEYSITFNNQPPEFELVDYFAVDGAAQWYSWNEHQAIGIGMTEYVRREAAGDDLLSLRMRLWPEDNYDPIRHRDFFSREGFNPPYLFIRAVCPVSDGAPEISNMLRITNVGKVVAPNIDITESWPVEDKKAIIPKETAWIKIEGPTRTVGPLKMPPDFGSHWPYYLSEGTEWWGQDLSYLLPGETMTIAMEFSVNYPVGFSGSFVIDAMVSSCYIPPWKYPRAFDILVIGTDRYAQKTTSPIDAFPPVPDGYDVVHVGIELDPFMGFFRYAIIAPSPVNRNPIPQTRCFDMILDPPAVDLNDDGVIDAQDVELVRQAIIGLIPYDMRMDTNVNNKIDTQDLAAFKLAAN